jgi:putative transposase
MAGKRDKPEEIMLKFRQVEVLQGQGMTISEAVRQIGVTIQTYYRWRKQRALSAIGPRTMVE